MSTAPAPPSSDAPSGDGTVTLASLGMDTTTRSQLSPELVERLAVTLERPVPTGPLPITWHWVFFVPVASTADLGADGHPRRPPGRLTDTYPRRMFAGGRLQHLVDGGGLRAGIEAVRESEITAAEEKSGRSGSLLVVTVRHTYRQDGRDVLSEEQDLVYRPASDVPTPLPVPAAGAPGPSNDESAAPDGARTIEPSRPLLFRYSALTFNAHRIHYDLPYATGEEGYPELVVHGPLTATSLADLAAEVLGRPLRTFAFRATAPLFAGQPVRLTARAAGEGCALEARRVDDAVAMTADAT